MNPLVTFVKFSLVAVSEGGEVKGYMRESNTFGDEAAPWLTSVFTGTIDEASGEIQFTKQYDGNGGQAHAVEYEGMLNGETGSGTWSIGDQEGTFSLRKVPESDVHPLSGVWSGSYEYPDGDPRPAVPWTMVVWGDANRFTAMTREEKTFGGSDELWLTGDAFGSLDLNSGEVEFIKKYDGTGNVFHQVVYKGERSDDSMEGTFHIGSFSGTFSVERVAVSDWIP